uniref:Branched-chain-amino-acid aminotransferase n=1 Tax=Kwoniella dejecticola CBS 10117 TaxID=1296121 RepID=A0A1A6ADT5_9TREE|nr:branched-chain-amino-acid transaminase [Kwoniella dejecticola CBS 10117]OBR88204.1 branched-chain-amino-acid transaminase [Kwoniella dejecticola CBS 10117]
MTTSKTNGHTLAPIKASSLYFTPLPPTHVVPPGKESHGRYMLTIPWNRVSGWGQPKIGPRQDLSFDPLAGVLQYAVTCFEGMKCYKTDQGDVRLFRPNKNFDRLKRSAARLGLPCEWDNDELLELFAKLMALETPLVPDTDGSNLYIRPTLLETSEGFGIKEDAFAGEALLYVVTTLNLGKGLYPSSEPENKGIKLDACKEFIRAWPGGTGSYKLGANYAGTVNISKKPGYAMSLWLHGREDFISEAGAMNVFIVKEAADGYLEFTTMSLNNGIVLPGVTRESIIELLEEHASGKKDFPIDGIPRKIRVVERDISMPEIIAGLEDGSLKGMFGCGTGVVVVQIGEIQYQSKTYHIPSNPIIKILRDTITGIQRGKIDEGKSWSYKVPEWNPEGKEGDEEEHVTAA